ncbi:hypothetical protein GCM10017771_87810 [Streptomyces capitiformicae]|uniref:Bacteriocin n=1 Tax=Streptomyces capitiformicae TaxID=2014920 RepID=A0A919DMU0_9ACTN|nr:hypothetical protein GCM10017771_87810 [Streptomyces capitiformicae]
MLPNHVRVLTDNELEAIAGGASLDTDATSMARVDQDTAPSAASSAHGAPRGEWVAPKLRGR